MPDGRERDTQQHRSTTKLSNSLKLTAVILALLAMLSLLAATRGGQLHTLGGGDNAQYAKFAAIFFLVSFSVAIIGGAFAAFLRWRRAFSTTVLRVDIVVTACLLVVVLTSAVLMLRYQSEDGRRCDQRDSYRCLFLTVCVGLGCFTGACYVVNLAILAAGTFL